MTWKTLMMSAGVAAIVAGGAVAQDTTANDDTMMQEGTTSTYGDGTGEVAATPSFTSIEEMSVGDVVGFVAFDPEGNRIAEIDYVIDGVSGPQAVLGIGGFLGLGEYTVALPLADFELGPDGNSFVLSTDKETLKEQPEFDETDVEGLPPETMISDLMADADTGSDMGTSGSDDMSGDTEMETETDMEAETDMDAEATTEDDAAADTEMEEDTSMEEGDAAADTESEGPVEEDTEETDTQ